MTALLKDSYGNVMFKRKIQEDPDNRRELRKARRLVTPKSVRVYPPPWGKRFGAQMSSFFSELGKSIDATIQAIQAKRKAVEEADRLIDQEIGKLLRLGWSFRSACQMMGVNYEITGKFFILSN